MKLRNLSNNDIKEFALESAKLRYNEDEIDNINIDDLFKVNRNEDVNNDLWTVFNRVQENLTHDIRNKDLDIKLNKNLFQLAESFS
jgi:hypothetical protein